MNILVTGASGFIGTALVPRLLERGHKVYGVSRHPPAPAENLIPLQGDILEPGLGLKEVPADIEAVQHLAGLHNLGEDKDGSIWATNVTGTRNVINFCLKHKIPHLYFTSTAYTFGRNVYEQSKAYCEYMVNNCDIPEVTIFKPSIIMGTPEHFYPGHFSQFVKLLIKVHQRAEIIRRKAEGALRLPVIEPIFRMKANPQGKLNLVPISAVAEAMATIDKPGFYWLTHPEPPTLEQLVGWISEFILVKVKINAGFKPTPIETMFERMAVAFEPYLWGDDFKSDLSKCPAIGKDFIHDTIRRSLD
ncbi:ADP-L-glycero-D-manno-heptose-6-epimerase [subsurface metagenome]